MHSERGSGALGVAAVVAVALGSGCGGKAVLDPGDGGATGGGEACACQAASDCGPSGPCGSYLCEDCACTLVPSPEATACPDGYCDGAGACFTRAEICSRACDFIPGCMTSSQEECYAFCFDDLQNCSSAELYETDRCTDELTPVCQADAWLACITPIACLAVAEGP